METFLLHNYDYQRLYNCSFKSYDEWLEYGVKHAGLGSLYLALGTLYIGLYVPILVVMTRPTLIKYSCWRIMFFLGIVDCCSTVVTCIIPGYFGILGVVPCNYMTFFYVAGCIAMGLWFTQCITCCVLALNRCVDFWKSSWMTDIFEGKRILFWIALSLTYGFWGFWHGPSALFNSVGMAYFLDPYFYIPMEEVDLPRNVYVGFVHSMNNIGVAIILPLLHGILVISVWRNSRGASSESLSNIQRKLFIQVFLICFLNFTGASIYIYMQFFPVPAFLVLVAQMTWQGSNGGAVVIYLTLNRTIRSGVLRMVCAPFGKFQVADSSIGPSNGRGDDGTVTTGTAK